MDALIKDRKMERTADTMDQKPKKRTWKKILFLIVLGVIVFVIISWLKGGALGGGDYQAVFLDNDQVYFGKVSSGLGSSFITLKDIFYLQVNQQLQPVEEGQPQQPQFILVKLGLREIHGPTDEMRINRDHIIFIEDLKSNSEIVKGIKQFKESQ